MRNQDLRVENGIIKPFLFIPTKPISPQILREISSSLLANCKEKSIVLQATPAVIIEKTEAAITLAIAMNKKEKSAGTYKSNSIIRINVNTIISQMVDYLVCYGALIKTNDPDRRWLFDQDQMAKIISAAERTITPILGKDRNVRLQELLEDKEFLVTQTLPLQSKKIDEDQKASSSKEIPADLLGELAHQTLLKSLEKFSTDYPKLKDLCHILSGMCRHAGERSESQVVEDAKNVSTILNGIVKQIEDNAFSVTNNIFEDERRSLEKRFENISRIQAENMEAEHRLRELLKSISDTTKGKDQTVKLTLDIPEHLRNNRQPAVDILNQKIEELTPIQSLLQSKLATISADMYAISENINSLKELVDDLEAQLGYIKKAGGVKNQLTKTIKAAQLKLEEEKSNFEKMAALHQTLDEENIRIETALVSLNQAKITLAEDHSIASLKNITNINMPNEDNVDLEEFRNWREFVPSEEPNNEPAPRAERKNAKFSFRGLDQQEKIIIAAYKIAGVITKLKPHGQVARPKSRSLARVINHLCTMAILSKEYMAEQGPEIFRKIESLTLKKNPPLIKAGASPTGPTYIINSRADIEASWINELIPREIQQKLLNLFLEDDRNSPSK